MNVRNDQIPVSEVFSNRIPEPSVPLLVIGLGGTGEQFLNAIKKTFAERFEAPAANDDAPAEAAHTAFLMIDTDMMTKYRWPAEEYVDLTMPDLHFLLDSRARPYTLTPYEDTWVSDRINSNPWGSSSRQSTRFILSRKHVDVSERIQQVLQQLLKYEHGGQMPARQVEIAICTGVCGVTGSGLFLDLPQIIRHSLECTPGLCGIPFSITGYIVTPDVSLLPLGYGNPAAENLLATGYAALKELDFWMNMEEHKTPYTMFYPDGRMLPWTNPPYDTCFLLSSTTLSGERCEKPMDAICQTVAEHLVHCRTCSEFVMPPRSQTAPGEENFRIARTGYRSQCTNRLPLHYGYSTLGIHTLRFPLAKLMSMEALPLLATFLPFRSADGTPCPNHQLLEDGQTLQRVERILGKPQTLHGAFAAALPLPGFCSISPEDKAGAEHLRQMDPPPHEQENMRPYQWLQLCIQPAAGQTAAAYLQDAWQRFEDFCSSVISKPELGPYALRDYLGHPENGLIAALEKEAETWTALAGKFQEDLPALRKACVAHWPDVLHPPLLGRVSALERYLCSLNNYYSALRRIAFMESHADAAQTLLQRIRDYLTQALTPLCEDLTCLNEAFIKYEPEHSPISSDLINPEILRPAIQEHFARCNEHLRISHAFLEMLCQETFRTEPACEGSSDLAFLYSQDGPERIQQLLRSTLNECFPDFSNPSPDAAVARLAGEDASILPHIIHQIIDAALPEVLPLFSQDMRYAGESCLRYLCLAVPESSPVFLEAARDLSANTDMTVKASQLNDQICVLTVWDGIPLYRYAGLTDMHASYVSALRDNPRAATHHLVCKSLDSDRVSSNWSLLPEPAPFYFTAPDGPAAEDRRWQEARALITEALRCGILEVTLDEPAPTFRVRLFCDMSSQHTPTPSSMLLPWIHPDPVPTPEGAEPPTFEHRLAALDRLETQIHTFTLKSRQPATCMIPALELTGQDCDPWDQEILAHPERKADAEKNHRFLCEALAAATLLPHLELMEGIADQIAVFDALRTEREALLASKKRWAGRVSFSENYARLLYHNLVECQEEGAFYTDDNGERKIALQPEDIHPDLAQLPLYLRTGAALADLPLSSPVRASLDQQMVLREEEYSQKSLNSELTAEEYQRRIDACTQLLETISGETALLQHRLPQAEAEAAALTKAIAFLTLVKDFLTTRKGHLEWSLQMVS